MEKLKNILEENDKISNITCKDECAFKQKQYMFGADCTLSTEMGDVSVFIGVPQNWELNLFDIYIKDNKFKFIPHMDTSGKLCLFELEASLIDVNFRGILNQYISRAVDIINDGLSDKNKLDFIEEFGAYWAKLKNVLFANIYVPNIKITQKIHCAVENIKKLPKQSNLDYQRKKNKPRVCISNEPNDFKNLQYNYSVINGVYVYLKAKDYIFPPDPREEISVDYVNFLLSLIDDENDRKLILGCQNLKYLFFEILQPNGIVNLVGISFDNCVIERTYLNILKISTFKTYRPIFMKNISKDNLLSRVKNKEQYRTKRILLLGCGSIGSYVLNELAKGGFEDITVIDNDMLFDENIFRHFLGNKYVGKYKTVAMSEYLNENIPGMKIKTLEALIEDVLEDESIELNDYDYIISAIGNHNVNRWLNKYMYNNHLSIPVIYAWNEVLGIGNHIALIRYGNLGCYECFFSHDEMTGILYDKTSYCAKNQKVAKKLSGCGSYVPYGSTVSLKTAGMCVDILKSEIVSPNANNYIISSKGDKLFFLREGLQLSPKYENQINTVETLYGDKFYQKGCNVCKNVN